MKITLSGKKGRSTVSNTIDVRNLQDEEELQEVVLSFFDFLIAMGAELPDELLDLLDEYDGSN